MPPRTSLKTFLATARAALTVPSSKRPTPLTFVVGNESADLDSLCSALLLAYFETYIPPKKRASIGDGNGSTAINNLHIPVCHLCRADLALRPEFAAVLRDADVTGDDMVTLEDVIPSHHQQHDDESKTMTTGASVKGVKDSTEAIRPEDTRWLLVDHNAMTGVLAKTFASHVIGCIDHHADEAVIPRDADPRVIAKTGSCTTLVLEHCADAWGSDSTTSKTAQQQQHHQSTTAEETLEAAKINAQLARLALAPILIDTSGLQDKDKTTSRDERAVARAEAEIAAYDELLLLATRSENNKKEGEEEEGGGSDEKRYDRQVFFERIASLKEDLTEMSIRDILRKDYKEWSVGPFDNNNTNNNNHHLGTSSMPRGFDYLLHREAAAKTETKTHRDAGKEFLTALTSWGAERDETLQRRGQGSSSSTGDDASKMDLVAVFTGFKDASTGNFARELLLWARSAVGVRAAGLFVARYSEELRLEVWGEGVLDLSAVSGSGSGSGLGATGTSDDGDGDSDRNGDVRTEWRRCWKQGALGHSRKQIAPMLRDVLAEASKR